MENFMSKYVNTTNPITKFFNKIHQFALAGGDYSKNIEWLEAMKEVPLYVKSISIYSNNAEELEYLTDPNLHNTPIRNLEFKLLKSFNISSKTIENLKAIHPNSITLSDNSIFNDEAQSQDLFGNFTKLLLNLDQTSLEMRFWNNDYSFKLEFRDLILKVVESKSECLYIRAKSVETGCTDEEFCWVK